MIKKYEYQGSSSVEDKLRHSLNYGLLHHFFMGVIVVYAIFLSATGTSLHNETYEWLHSHFHSLAWGLFILEIVLKLFIEKRDFFNSNWNITDASLLLLTLLEPQVKILRILRLFVYLNTFFNHKVIDRVVNTLSKSMPSLITSGGVLLSIMCSYSLLSTTLFSEQFPEFFGHMGRSLYTLFQIMTLESWSAGIVRPVMEVYPWAWVVFVTYILLSTYGITNIFVGVIVNAMNVVDSESSDDPSLSELQDQIKELKELIQKK